MSNLKSNIGIAHLGRRLESIGVDKKTGTVLQTIGDLIEAHAPPVLKGSFASIDDCVCEVVGFREDRVLLMPLDQLKQVKMGSSVVFRRDLVSVPVGPELLGRVIDPLGRPLDGKGEVHGVTRYPLNNRAPNPMKRDLISKSLKTGVRVIDGMLTIGQGQRICIMAGSGVGKSTLMGMLAKKSSADINVIALVGERGREVREFIERDLGSGIEKSVMVVSTSDVSPALQIKGVQAAMSIAEYFRDKGKHVLVMTDSLTRLAMAQRQIGLSAGEPPTSKGYPPSVFTMLPRLLERGGTGENGGSITSVSTVLIEADDINDPIGDTVRSIVDGHVVLSRRLVSYGHYPPVDVLQSLSRTMSSTTTKDHQDSATSVRKMMAIYEENEELIRLGAYKKGSDPMVDKTILMKPKIDSFLQQDRSEFTSFENMLVKLNELYQQIEQKNMKRSGPTKK